MSASSPVLRFVPQPKMDPFGTSGSVYCLEIAGRPLHQHIVDAFCTKLECNELVLLIDDPALRTDETALELLKTRGDVVLGDGEARSQQAYDSSSIPTTDGRGLRFAHPWDLLAINQMLLSNLTPRVSSAATIEDGVEIAGNVIIEDGVRVLAGARLKGNVYLGPNTFVGNNASVRGATSVGAGSVIGAAADVKNSLLGSGAGIGTLCFMGDSVFGDNVWLAGVARTSNTRLDSATVTVLGDDVKVDTGLATLGVFVGSDVAIGSAVLILPGRKIGSGALIGPHVIVDKNIPPHKRVVLAQNWSVSDR